jgi:hypothetical protein
MLAQSGTGGNTAWAYFRRLDSPTCIEELAADGLKPVDRSASIMTIN